jgi:CRISPR-associated protein Csm2
MNEIMDKIKRLNKLSELKEEDFAIPKSGIAYRIAQYFSQRGQKITISQLRKIFSEILSVCEDAERDLNQARGKKYKIYPKIYYAMGRQLIPHEFKEILETILDKVKDNEDFERLKDFMIALVAYFTAFEKGEGRYEKF